MVADISKLCETNVVQMWLVSPRTPEQWWCLREMMWKSGWTMEIYWKGDEMKGSAVWIVTLCIKVFTLINSLPNYDSFNSTSSHCFRVLEHWLQSCYFGLQSWLSDLWSVHHLYQVSPLERQEQFYFSLQCTDVLKKHHKSSS